MSDPLLSGPGTLDVIPPLRLPDPEKLFAQRAERFAALAPGNTLGEYLHLLARLAAAQRVALGKLSARAPSAHREFSRSSPPERSAAESSRSVHPERSAAESSSVHPERSAAESSRSVHPERSAAESKGPVSLPLDATNHRRDPIWRTALATIVEELARADLPAETRDTLELLGVLPPPEVEALADRVLANAVTGSDLAAGPFAAAALQVYFTSAASRLDVHAVAPQRDGCPVCGSQPVVGVVLGDDKVRYLVCSLCASQWHHTRVECTVCHKGPAVSYYSVEGAAAAKEPLSRGAAKAEACSACKVYTKLFYTEKDPALEPFADDVATLPLDLLMAENGWERHGVNLFLLPGEVKAPPLAS